MARQLQPEAGTTGAHTGSPMLAQRQVKPTEHSITEREDGDDHFERQWKSKRSRVRILALNPPSPPKVGKLRRATKYLVLAALPVYVVAASCMSWLNAIGHYLS